MTSPIQRWADHMRFTGAAPSTVTTRTRMMRRVEKDHGDPLSLTRTDLIAFLAQYDHPATRSTMLAYLRAFYRWALSEDLVAADPTTKIPAVKVPNGVPRPAPVEDVRRALDAASPRTRSFALLMAYAGLRCCEVAGVRPEHFTQNAAGRWFLDIPRSKGGHQQVVPVPEWVVQEVLAGPTWSVSVQTVQKDVRDAFRAVGSSATPHQLRHLYGTSALHSTQNLRVVQQMMRHASPATTARYTLVESSETSDAAEGLPRIA